MKKKKKMMMKKKATRMNHTRPRKADILGLLLSAPVYPARKLFSSTALCDACSFRAHNLETDRGDWCCRHLGPSVVQSLFGRLLCLSSLTFPLTSLFSLSFSPSLSLTIFSLCSLPAYQVRQCCRVRARSPPCAARRRPPSPSPRRCLAAPASPCCPAVLALLR